MSSIIRFYLVLLFAIVACTSGFGQANQSTFDLRELKSRSLQLSTESTTTISFPSAIVSFDRGSEGIIAKKALGSENILRVKGSIVGFKATSLAVLTKNGKLYSFLASYDSCPASINFVVTDVKGGEVPNDKVQSTLSRWEHDVDMHTTVWESLFNNEAKALARSKSLGINVRVLAGGIRDGKMYFGITYLNTTNVDMDINRVRVKLKARQKVKDITTQEFDIPSEVVYGDSTKVDANSTKCIVVGIDKMIIRRDQFLEFDVMEEDGARHLLLKVPGRVLLRLKLLS